MIRYYKLFDMLNRRGMKKTDLLEIISAPTLAKLSKGQNVQTDVIDKICLFLDCQPGDIMEVAEYENDKNDEVFLLKKETERIDIEDETYYLTKSAVSSYNRSEERHEELGAVIVPSKGKEA